MAGVLSTRGNTELVESEAGCESLLDEALLGQQGGNAMGSLVAEGWIEQSKLLDLTELVQELFDGQVGPGCLRLAMNVLKQ